MTIPVFRLPENLMIEITQIIVSPQPPIGLACLDADRGSANGKI